MPVKIVQLHHLIHVQGFVCKHVSCYSNAREGEAMENTSYYRSEYLEVIRLTNRAFTYTEHNHVSIFTIGFVLDGKITLIRKGQHEQHQRKSFFVIAPFQVHGLLLPNTYDMLTICVHKNVVETWESQVVVGVLSEMLSSLAIPLNTMVLRAAIDEMYRCNAPPPANRAILLSVATLRQHPERNYGVHGLAKQASYSPYYYLKKFKLHIGLTPHKFQLQSRVRKAQRMIEAGEMSTDTALTLGFYDQSHFIKCFKHIVGLTPSEYRKSVKKMSDMTKSTQCGEKLGE